MLTFLELLKLQKSQTDLINNFKSVCLELLIPIAADIKNLKELYKGLNNKFDNLTLTMKAPAIRSLEDLAEDNNLTIPCANFDDLSALNEQLKNDTQFRNNMVK